MPGSETSDVQRVLRLTFELRVPRGLRANIRGERVVSAADSFTSAVQALASQVFPWASELKVRREWAYVHYDPPLEPIPLPATDKNTV